MPEPWVDWWAAELAVGMQIPEMSASHQSTPVPGASPDAPGEAASRRRAFEALLQRVAGSLLALHSGATVDSVPVALSMLAELFPVEHIWFWLAESPLDGEAAAGRELTQDDWLPECWTWTRPGETEVPRELWCVPEYPWAHERLASGAVIDSEAWERMGREAPDERARWEEVGVADLLVVPVLHRGRLIGALGLVSRSAPSNDGRWEPRDRALLTVAGAMLMRVVDRLRSLEAVQRSATQYRELAERLEELVEARTREVHHLLRVQVELDKHAALGRMAATIAHEVNNPLAGVVNALSLVKDAVPPEDPRARYLGMIERETTRIEQFVRRFFDLYRPGQPTPHRFELATAVQDVVALLAFHAGERAVQLETDAMSVGEVRLPEALVRQVLFNLIRNAIDASPEGGVVEVSARTENEQLLLCIADNGAGVAPDILERVFDRNFTTKQGYAAAGLGLGLTISRDIVSSLGGSIRFESAEGRGTRVHVALPLVAATSAALDQPPGDGHR